MADIEQVDRNFVVETSLNIENYKFYDVRQEPFTIYGVFYENERLRRIPEEVAKTVNDSVYNLHDRTAGGRVKFITNSSYVAIKAVLPKAVKLPHFTNTGSAGFDMYVGRNEEYFAAFTPPFNVTGGYESVMPFDNHQEKEITINFPLYSSVSELYIGLEANATLKKAPEYKHKKPIVFYGSSITQGGCASRPGTAYTSMVSRNLQSDHINLGFAGGAKGENEIAEYIKGLDMSVFVYDYDYNAPTIQHLQETHPRMYRLIRESHPDLPIVMLSRPKYKLNQDHQARRDLIQKTYDDAVAAGDKNVYFIDGPTLMKYVKNEGTVDRGHPNDMGFYSMAKVLTKLLKKLI